MRLELEASVDELEARISKEIPVVLAQAKKRPIGAPGRATYLVKRGKPRIKATPSAISLVVPVKMDISVCKPVGSFCLNYGKCSPRYDVEVSMPARPTKHYGIPRPSVRARVRRGCTIGLDVTSHITKIVKAQLPRLEREIIAVTAAARPDLDILRQQLTSPVAAAEGRCAWLTPTRAVYRPPRIKDGLLRTEVGVLGNVEWARCEKSRAAPSLPEPEQVKIIEFDSLSIPERLTPKRLQTLLSDAIARDTSATSTRNVLQTNLLSLQLVEDALLLELSLAGPACGSAWVRAEVAFREQGLVLRDIEPISPALPVDVATQLVSTLEAITLADFETPTLLASHPWEGTLAEESRRLGNLLGIPVALEVNSPFRSADAQVTARGVITWFEHGATIKAKVGSGLADAPASP